MNKNTVRAFYIVTGLLDLLSLVRSRTTAIALLHGFHADLFWILHIALVLSLFFSGILLILGKKGGLVLYYFQFPLKLAFMTLSVGFLLSFIHLPPFYHKILLGLIIGVETIRLVANIIVHRRA